MVTGLRAGLPRNQVSIPGRGRIHFLWFWDSVLVIFGTGVKWWVKLPCIQCRDLDHVELHVLPPFVFCGIVLNSAYVQFYLCSAFAGRWLE